MDQNTEQQEQMPQADMQKNLAMLMGAVTQKKNQLDMMQSMSGAKSMQRKQQEIAQVFQMLKEAGVDPSNPNSVNAYLEKLYNTSPDLYQLIVPTLEQALGLEQQQQDNGA